MPVATVTGKSLVNHTTNSVRDVDNCIDKHPAIPYTQGVVKLMKERNMTIQIKQPFMYPYLVAVKVAGKCNHFCDVINELVEDESGNLRASIRCESCREDLTESFVMEQDCE